MKKFDRIELVRRLRRLGRILRKILVYGLLALALFATLVWLTVPDTGSVRQPQVVGTLHFETADKTVYRTGQPDAWTDWVPIDRMPVSLARMVVAVEDFRFFRHVGIDINQIYYALIENVRNLGFRYGASTITQQLVRNVWLSRDKSLIRKLHEAIMAVRLENMIDKQAVLEWYLNIVEFAPTVYGVGPASRFYFGKTPDRLTFEEQVFLAAVIHAPSWYAADRERARPRLARLAVNLIEQRLIVPVQATALSNARLTFVNAEIPLVPAGLRSALQILWPVSERQATNIVVKSFVDDASQSGLEELLISCRGEGHDRLVFVRDGQGHCRAVVAASTAGAARMRQATAGFLETVSAGDVVRLRRDLTEQSLAEPLAFAKARVFGSTPEWHSLPQ